MAASTTTLAVTEEAWAHLKIWLTEKGISHSLIKDFDVAGMVLVHMINIRVFNLRDSGGRIMLSRSTAYSPSTDNFTINAKDFTTYEETGDR